MPPVNFVVYNDLPIPATEQEAELQRLSQLSWEQGSREAVQHMWTWPVYCVTRDVFPASKISDTLSTSEVNVVIGEALRTLKNYDPLRHFVVAVRADFRPFRYANLEVVQNKSAIGKNCFYVPHLPQPNLMPRDPGRTKIENVAFFGKQSNLWAPQAEISELLSRLDLKFVVKRPEDWADYSDVDVALGIRTLNKHRHNNKPATKMFNAWFANVPFIGGNDSALDQCGHVGRDFLRATSTGELLSTLEALKAEPPLSASIIENARTQREAYSVEATRSAWLSLFEEVIFPRFDRWRRSSPSEKMARWAMKAKMAALERKPLLWAEKARFRLSML